MQMVFAHLHEQTIVVSSTMNTFPPNMFVETKFDLQLGQACANDFCEQLKVSPVNVFATHDGLPIIVIDSFLFNYLFFYYFHYSTFLTIFLF